MNRDRTSSPYENNGMLLLSCFSEYNSTLYNFHFIWQKYQRENTKSGKIKVCAERKNRIKWKIITFVYKEMPYQSIQLRVFRKLNTKQEEKNENKIKKKPWKEIAERMSSELKLNIIKSTLSAKTRECNKKTVWPNRLYTLSVVNNIESRLALDRDTLSSVWRLRIIYLFPSWKSTLHMMQCDNNNKIAKFEKNKLWQIVIYMKKESAILITT